MTLTRRAVILITCALAVVVFAVVQDRVTAAGARRYVAISRTAPATGAGHITIESVMTPAIRSSVLWGAGSAALVILAGLGVASRVRRT